MNVRRLALPAWSLWLCAAAWTAPAALAAEPAAKATPPRGAVVCNMPRGDARDNCLSEASTRRASTRPSAPSENPEQLARNALLRCEPLRGTDRTDCVARMQGQGTTTGSVADGGIYRELVTIEVGEVPAIEPAAPPAPSEPAR